MKKKIAFYIESMVVGGAEKVLIDLVNGLDAELFDITVIAVFKKSVYSNYEFVFEEGFAKHIRYNYLIDNSNRLKYRIFNFLYNRTSKYLIYKVLVKDEFDVEVAFYEGMPTDFVSYSSQNSRKIAWLHTLQEHLYSDLTTNRFFKVSEIYKKYHTVVGVSQAVCESFKKVFSLSKGAICLYNPVNEVEIRARAKYVVNDLHKFVGINFISVGRLVPLKGYKRLLSVCTKLNSEGYRFSLTIIGDGPERSDLENLISSESLEQCVKILGFRNNPFPYVAQSDCFVCSSHIEGYNIAMVEALLLHVPVISTNCGGPLDIVLNNRTGLICDNSEEGLYDAMKEILERPRQLENFRREIQKEEGRFSISSSMAQIQDFLLKK